ncbi:hypothetical protein H5P36_19910 [Bacillus sp. APMAM]|nr:hypothetical protein [Bacillus sp. APMAM]RTZ54109.1 hypothetical protein EKO25_19690 [Bacillus sp. SAJ1]
MIRKILLLSVFGIAILASSFLGVTNKAQAAGYYCSTSSDTCVDVKMTYGKAQYWSTPRIYFKKGQHFKYDFETSVNSLFHVGIAVFRVSDGAQITTPFIYAVGKGGDIFGEGDAPTSDYYYMMATCKGGDDTRCEGGGLLTKF